MKKLVVLVVTLMAFAGLFANSTAKKAKQDSDIPKRPKTLKPLQYHKFNTCERFGTCSKVMQLKSLQHMLKQ